ncbi:MAG: hypothetical protein GTO60_14990, partial [Gammaproteobacteria bacterium]|nr:hypothetical protein [Gammaproteobacteria bacterium]
MSQANKQPLEIARGIAEQLVSAFAEHCERIEIAGSIRRLRPDIGDIEIVAIPIIDRQQALFGDMTNGAEHNRLHVYLDDLMA